MADRYSKTRGINWAITPGRDAVIGTIPPVGMMAADETAQILDQCFMDWNVNAADDKTDALATLLAFFGEHGTSSELDVASYTLVSNGHHLDLRYFADYVNLKYRQFCRTYYNFYVYCIANDSIASRRIAAARGFDPSYSTIACDFHDRTQLTTLQRKYVQSKLRDAVPQAITRRGSVASDAVEYQDGFDL